MLEFLKKIFGAAAGLILYSLKSLLITLGLIIFNLILFPILYLGIPLATAVLYILEGDGLGVAFFAWAIMGTVLTFTLLPKTINRLFNIIIFEGPRDLFRSALLGIIDGYENGLFHVIRRSIFDFAIFSTTITNLLISLNLYSRAINDEALLALNDDTADYFNLEDVPHSSLSINPELHEQPEKKAIEFNPLSLNELELAGTIEDLKDTVKAYTSLHERLSALDADLQARSEPTADLDKVWDELSIIPIKEAALLVKQYNENGKWKVIPTRTMIIDKPSLETWLKNNNAHPQTREPMDKANPEIINNVSYPTRYRIRAYKNMNDAQELFELANTIRNKVALVDTSKLSVSDVLSYTFLGDKATAKTAPTQNAQNEEMVLLEDSEENREELSNSM